MNEFLLFLHFLGLMFGAAGGIASGVIMRQAAAMPADSGETLRQLGPVLARLAGTGVALLWITGLIMVFTIWGGFGALPGLFWVKFIFVLVLTACVGLIHMTYAEIRRTGNILLAMRLRFYGPISGLSALLAVLFAVYAFD